MSLAINFQGRKKKRTLLAKGLSADKFINALQALALKYKAILHKYDDMSCCIELCPAGFINFKYKRGYFEGDVRTNTAGPGFHKAAVDFLDSIGTVLDVQLLVRDATTFWEKRDFFKLQNAYIVWLHAMLKHLTQYKETEVLVSWPADAWRPIGFGEITTPMGNFSYRHITDVIDNKKITDFAQNYFIWYNADKDAYYHRGIALYLMWNEYCWAKARTEEEERLSQRILFHLEKARRLDAALPLPVFAWKEIAELSTARNIRVKGPNQAIGARIGYRRCDILIPFPGGWEVKLPGQFLVEAEEGGYVFWDIDRNFRFSAYTASSQEAAVFFARLEEPCTAGENLIEFELAGYKYKAKHGYIRERSDDQGYWILHGQIIGMGKMAVVAIAWQDEKLEGWAVDVFKNVLGPKPEHIA